MKLRLGPDLAVPDDAVTQTFVVFGKRGSGKSNTGVVLAEEMHRAGGQIIVLDPIGAWWGLKASFDGSSVGLPVYVFGGLHGDLPLSSTAGQLMAQVAISHRIPMVLDMTGWSGAERARFVTAFARWLLEHNDRVPVHVFLEEADAFIPQRPYKGEEEMLGAMDRLIRWGRAAGIGATAITQRSAKINKDVTTQAEVLIAHRTIGPQDVAAIKAWIQYHASGDEQQTVLSTLPTLPDGTAWVWSPDWLGMLRQVAFRRRETFDSASTPKLGEKRAQPKEMAPVDVDRLRDQLADTIEKAKADDPAVLRKRIAELEQSIVKSQAEYASTIPETVVERVEVPVLNGQMDDLRTAITGLADIGMRLLEVATAVGDAAAVIQTTGKDIGGALTSAQMIWQGRPLDRVEATPRPAVVAIPTVQSRSSALRADAGASGNPPRLTGAPLAAAGASTTAPGDAPPDLSKAERAILSAVTSYPIGLTREQLAFLANYHPRSKGFTNALGTLRTRGLITPGYPAEATADGHMADVTGAPYYAGAALAEVWLARFGRAEAAILRTVIDIYPQAATREDLAAAAGFEHVRSKGFTNALGRLRGLGLVDGMALHADFARLLGR